MEKILIFDLYRNVANIVEDAYAENPDLYQDEEYISFTKTVLNMIVEIDSNRDLVELSNHVYGIRGKYFRHSVGYDIFNSILDAINETVDNL